MTSVLLECARERQVLRQGRSGIPVPHANLQDRLADTYAATIDEAPSQYVGLAQAYASSTRPTRTAPRCSPSSGTAI